MLKQGRKVAVLGAIGPHKGSGILYSTAEASLQEELALEFVIIGYTDRDSMFQKLRNVKLMGRYERLDIVKKIHAERPDLIWIPSVLPETFCFTLSEAVAAGVQPVVFDLGAQADRVRSLEWGSVMPLELMRDPKRAASFLASCEISDAVKGLPEKLIRRYPTYDSYYTVK